jgi:hypothetical protein
MNSTRLHGATTQKTVIFVLTAVKNLKSYSILILYSPLRLGLSSGLYLSGAPTFFIGVSYLSHACYTSTHLILLDLLAVIILSIEYKF